MLGCRGVCWHTECVLSAHLSAGASLASPGPGMWHCSPWRGGGSGGSAPCAWSLQQCLGTEQGHWHRGTDWHWGSLCSAHIALCELAQHPGQLLASWGCATAGWTLSWAALGVPACCPELLAILSSLRVNYSTVPVLEGHVTSSGLSLFLQHH